jgi:heme/copper-type cytochrome/quinol oxidase subunit 2
MKRILALLLLASSSAFAQCVMCFRTAAAQQSERAKVLNLGIVIMLIPPVLILAGFLALCYKRRNTYAAAESAETAPVDHELEEMFSGDRR